MHTLVRIFALSDIVAIGTGFIPRWPYLSAEMISLDDAAQSSKPMPAGTKYVIVQAMERLHIEVNGQGRDPVEAHIGSPVFPAGDHLLEVFPGNTLSLMPVDLMAQYGLNKRGDGLLDQFRDNSIEVVPAGTLARLIPTTSTEPLTNATEA